MTNISQWLDSGESIIKKQNVVFDQGFSNQSDGTLYLTNRQLAFQVSQSTLMRGLELKIAGQRDVKVEFIMHYFNQMSTIFDNQELVDQYDHPHDLIIESMNFMFYGLLSKK